MIDNQQGVDMYKAEVMAVEGTGAGYGFPAHVYIQGVGIAMSRSPQKALRTARILCQAEMSKSSMAQLGVGGVGLIPVLGYSKLWKDGKLIYNEG